MQNLYTTLEAWISDLTSDSTKLKGQWVGLYKGINAPLGPSLKLSDLVEANYSGYARQQLGTWNPPYVDQANLVICDAPSMFFVPSDTVTTNSVLGAFMGSASAAGNLVLVDPFTTPIGMNSPDTAFTYVPRVGFDPAGNYGQGTVIS